MYTDKRPRETSRSLTIITMLCIMLPTCSSNKDPLSSTSFTLTEEGVVLGNGCLVSIDKSARSYSEDGSCDGENYTFEFNLITMESNTTNLQGYTATNGNQTLVFGNPDIIVDASPSLSPDDLYAFPMSISLSEEPLPFPVTIYYTLDNTDPSPSNGTARVFESPLLIEEDTILLFRAIAQVGVTGSVRSATYKFPITYTRSFSVFGTPHSLAWDGSNLWYLSNNKLVQIDQSGNQLSQVEVPWSDTGGFTSTGDGFWISHSTGTANIRSKVSKVNQIGIVRTTFDYVASSLTDPIWDGQWVSCVSPSGWIQTFDETGAQVGSSISAGSTELKGLAWDGIRFWALDLTDNAIHSLRYQPNSSTGDFLAISLNGFREQVGLTTPFVHTWHGIVVADGKLWLSTPYDPKNLHQFEIKNMTF